MVISTKLEMLRDPNIWIADTGASLHTTPHAAGIKDKCRMQEETTIHTANGKVPTTKTGLLKGKIYDKNGNNKQTAIMTGVHVMPGGSFNLFSLTKIHQAGWTLKGKKEISISNGSKTITFDLVFPTKQGAIYAVYFKWDSESEVANANILQVIKMSVQQAHDQLGHSSKAST